MLYFRVLAHKGLNIRSFSAWFPSSVKNMKKFPLILLFGFCAAASLLADDQLLNVQKILKDRGFFYGTVNGAPGADTTAAIRRYQIRNGLAVTGTLTPETLESLKLKPARQPNAATAQRVEQPAEQSEQYDDQRRESVPMPWVRDPVYSALFARTPYEIAPLEVQEIILRRAQMLLQREGLYYDRIDGSPGPVTTRAVVGFQAKYDLPRTGRMDMYVLKEMRLLPGEANSPFHYLPTAPGPAYTFSDFYGGIRVTPSRNRASVHRYYREEVRRNHWDY